MGAVDPTGEERGWLSDSERRRGERFQRGEDARAFLARRVWLRIVLAGYLGCSPAELVLAQEALGKPALVRPDAAGLRFNLSRSGEWLLLGVARGREVGVDVEREAVLPADAEGLSRLAARVLSPAERAAFAALPAIERRPALLRVWARKEALLKCQGVGLAREPAGVEVGLRPLVGNALPGAALGLADLQAPPGCAAAVAAEGSGWRMRAIAEEVQAAPRSR
jgi:4'-phosphopantetheinyl transferase